MTVDLANQIAAALKAEFDIGTLMQGYDGEPNYMVDVEQPELSEFIGKFLAGVAP